MLGLAIGTHRKCFSRDAVELNVKVVRRFLLFLARALVGTSAPKTTIRTLEHYLANFRGAMKFFSKQFGKNDREQQMLYLRQTIVEEESLSTEVRPKLFLHQDQMTHLHHVLFSPAA